MSGIMICACASGRCCCAAAATKGLLRQMPPTHVARRPAMARVPPWAAEQVDDSFPARWWWVVGLRAARLPAEMVAGGCRAQPACAWFRRARTAKPKSAGAIAEDELAAWAALMPSLPFAGEGVALRVAAEAPAVADRVGKALLRERRRPG